MESESKEIGQEITQKILSGLELSFNRLMESKIKNDQSFVFLDRQGKIIHMKARDLRALYPHKPQ